MCGRYVNAAEPKKILDKYKIMGDSTLKQYSLQPMQNITPGSIVPVITRDSQNILEFMKWGLVPHWAKDPKIGYKMINARAESVAEKPSFKDSFHSKRCLVPATGFYEWMKSDNGKIKTPYLIQLKNHEIFSFAGLFDIWKDAEGKEFKTFTIITTEPNEIVKPIHNRMPVILNDFEEEIWLKDATGAEELLNILNPFPDNLMEFSASSL